MKPPQAAVRAILVVVVPPVDELDLVGPVQVFSAVNRLAGRPVYAIDLVATADNLKVAGEAGVLTFLAHRCLRNVTREYDSALLVCGLASRRTRDAALTAWLKDASNRLRRLGAVCVGAFLLAEAGLLSGRRVTSHWRFGSELAKRYPRIKVVPPQLWVKDGNIYTSAGISAGIDLALVWVEEDCGTGTAHEVARELVLFLRRPGGQPQLSISLAAQASEMRALQELQLWIAENLQKRLGVEELASHVAMSVRNFERVFTREVGLTPAQYVLHARVEAARRELHQTDNGFKQVAAAAGFGSVDSMRRVFVRLRHHPADLSRASISTQRHRATSLKRSSWRVRPRRNDSPRTVPTRLAGIRSAQYRERSF